MQSITFTCEVITPMFLAGADGQTPELRAPSIKGALRFWWRALNGHLSLEKLKAKEDDIFGGTDRRSKFNIRVRLLNKVIGNRLPGGMNIKYMAYGADERKYFDIKTKFKVIFSIREKNELKLQQIKTEIHKAFSVLSHLGGLGAKSRNGFGAFICSEIDSFDAICNYPAFKRNIDASFTTISNLTQIYQSEQSWQLSPNTWKSVIKQLKQIYADDGKKSIQQKNDRVYIAAPYKKIKPPERHAKLHIMSLTKINDSIHFVITFLPYLYLKNYPDLKNRERDVHAKKWEKITDKFNTVISELKNRNGDYLLNFTFDSDN